MFCQHCNARTASDCTCHAPTVPVDFINDRGRNYELALRDMRPAGWHTMETAPKDRPIIIGWVDKTFKLANVIWMHSALGEGWTECDDDGNVWLKYHDHLPKWWHEDTLGLPADAH